MPKLNTPPCTATLLQRNRRLLLSLPVCALPLLSACGGSEPPDAGSSAAAPDPSVAPSSLSYDTDQALYQLSEPITSNNPHVTGGTTATFSVTPALPPSLHLDPITGVISGTPTAMQRQAIYTVSAGNAAGSAQAQVRITVTGRGAWSAVPSIAGARQYASIARLPGGRFLVIGGLAGGAWTNTAQIYDPVPALWSPAANTLVTRMYPASVALADGRVLVFGGGISGGVATATAELYDPANNSWTPTGNMVEPRMYALAHRLASGKVLVTGGLNSGVVRNTVELYDPGTGTWSLLPTPMLDRRLQHAVALLPGGNTLLIAGGLNTSGYVTSAELYDVDGNATTPVAYGVTGNRHRAVPLDDGSVLVVVDTRGESYRFHPDTSTWTTSDMISAAGTRDVRNVH